MSVSIIVEYSRDGASRKDQTDLRGMVVSDRSESKWIKMTRDRLERSYQVEYYRGGSIIVETIKKRRADLENYTGAGRA